MGASLLKALQENGDEGRLDLGCVAAHGYFHWDRESGEHDINTGGKAATAFLFTLISLLQFSGTVPMIDVQAYAAWLSK